MEFISNCTADKISKAAQSLKDGHLVAFPTETVYGLGADATNENAVSRIYSVKGRPVGHPLIVHISSTKKLDQWATDIPDYAIKLAREFWPGPMTLILPRADLAKDFITGGQNNVGLRVPAQPIALALLKKFEDLGGQGVAAPSANRFGAVSPTTAEAVSDELREHLESQDLVLDGGHCHVGIESTIIDCTETVPSILRSGFILERHLKSLEIPLISNSRRSHVKFSGNLLKHYSPRTKLVLVNHPNEIPSGEAMIALSIYATPNEVARIAAPGNMEEYAKILYQAFRLADLSRLERVYVIPPVGEGIAGAIRDRIYKATGVFQH
jgi:L-threonylcarbamoyladenylate synthase